MGRPSKIERECARRERNSGAAGRGRRFRPEEVCPLPSSTTPTDYRVLRQSDPVHRMPDGSYSDALRRLPVGLSRHRNSEFGQEARSAKLLTASSTSTTQQAWVFNHPPDHTLVRKLLAPAFTPHRRFCGTASKLRPIGSWKKRRSRERSISSGICCCDFGCADRRHARHSCWTNAKPFAVVARHPRRARTGAELAAIRYRRFGRSLISKNDPHRHHRNRVRSGSERSGGDTLQACRRQPFFRRQTAKANGFLARAIDTRIPAQRRTRDHDQSHRQCNRSADPDPAAMSDLRSHPEIMETAVEEFCGWKARTSSAIAGPSPTCRAGRRRYRSRQLRADLHRRRRIAIRSNFRSLTASTSALSETGIWLSAPAFTPARECRSPAWRRGRHRPLLRRFPASNRRRCRARRAVPLPRLHILSGGRGRLPRA